MGTPLSTQSVERSAIRKVAVRLVPFVALMFFINYLDRTAISFAGPNGMNEDLGLSAAQFGFASGIFFAGYILLEIPSNMALYKFGARRWLARIMVSWGIVSLLFTFVQNIPEPLRAADPARCRRSRLLPRRHPVLELVGSRAVPQQDPGVVLPRATTDHRDRCAAGRTADQAARRLRLEGWRFMFLCVSMPAILVGVIAWFYLADSPRQAKWLTPEEAEWLTGETESEAKKKVSHGSRGEFHGGGTQRPGLGACLHLLRIRLRAVRARLLPADHHRRVPGAVRHQVRCLREGTHHRDPVPAGRRGALSVVTRRHQARRANLAHRRTRIRRRTQRACRAVHGFTGRHHRGDHRDGVRHLRRTSQLLDGARKVPHRRGGRRGHRADQHLRQRGRLRRGIRDRLPQGSDRVLRRVDVRRGRLDGAVRCLDDPAQPGGGESSPPAQRPSRIPVPKFTASGPVR